MGNSIGVWFSMPLMVRLVCQRGQFHHAITVGLRASDELDEAAEIVDADARLVVESEFRGGGLYHPYRNAETAN